MQIRNDIFIIIISAVASFSYAQIDDSMRDVFNSNKNYCGEHLTTALSSICDGRYNTLQKSGSVLKKNYWDTQYMSDMPYPYQSKADASSMLIGYRRRKKRGVYNECCQKPCSREELSTYCASSSRRRRR